MERAMDTLRQVGEILEGHFRNSGPHQEVNTDYAAHSLLARLP
jgi:hypothetical protein